MYAMNVRSVGSVTAGAGVVMAALVPVDSSAVRSKDLL